MVDVVPMTIEHALTQPFVDELNKSLLQSLLSSDRTSSELGDLLAQDPEIAVHRSVLCAKRDRLVKIKRSLEEYRGGNYRGLDERKLNMGP